jgi:hypothetical protein
VICALHSFLRNFGHRKPLSTMEGSAFAASRVCSCRPIRRVIGAILAQAERGAAAPSLSICG